MIVTNVKVSDWNKDGTIVKVSNVTFDDGTEVPGYDLPPGLEEGKPLPEGWEVATAKSGKSYIKVPKPGKGGFGGGAAAFRNTKEGQAIEQQSIHASVALEWACRTYGEAWFAHVDDMFAWLRKTAGGTPFPSAGAGGAQPPAPPASSPEAHSLKDEGPSPSGRSSTGDGDVQAGGVTGEGASPACTHPESALSPLLPSGRAVKEGSSFCLNCRKVVRAA